MLNVKWAYMPVLTSELLTLGTELGASVDGGATRRGPLAGGSLIAIEPPWNFNVCTILTSSSPIIDVRCHEVTES